MQHDLGISIVAAEQRRRLLEARAQPPVGGVLEKLDELIV
jgi:hypothetical protein